MQKLREKLKKACYNNDAIDEIIEIVKNTPQEFENGLWASTPDNPCWVETESGKRILLHDLGDKVIGSRFICVTGGDENNFLKGLKYDWDLFMKATLIQTVTVEVPLTLVEKVEELIKENK